LGDVFLTLGFRIFEKLTNRFRLCRINQLFIGQCTEEFGYIIDIWKYHLDAQDDLEGVVQDTSGDVIFNVRFDVIAFKPFENEILDGEVYSVSKDGSGIEVHSGPIKCHIKSGVSLKSLELSMVLVS
jgi:DNA-directed RNA polymerase subunit E'/Rpb7